MCIIHVKLIYLSHTSWWQDVPKSSFIVHKLTAYFQLHVPSCTCILKYVWILEPNGALIYMCGSKKVAEGVSSPIFSDLIL